MLKQLFFFSLILVAFHQEGFSQSPKFGGLYSFDSCYIASSGQYLTGIQSQITNSSTGMSVTTYWGDGSSSTKAINGSYFNDIHTYTSAGTYHVMAVLMDNNNNPTDTAKVALQAMCQTIWGHTYKRNDANCTYDSGDQNITTPVFIELRKNNIAVDTIVSLGSFLYSIPDPDATSEYSLHPLTANTGYNLVCPSASSPFKFRLDTTYFMSSRFQFGFECNTSFTDFDLSTYMTGFLRTVSNSHLQINTGNSACTPKSGTLTLNISPKYSFASASVTPTSVSGQTISWDLNLGGTNASYIGVILNPVGTLTLGDTATHTTHISPTTGDIQPDNNSFTFTDTLRAAYDPNDKTVSPAGNIAPGTLLTYTINFENLGNDTAFNIHIIDTLSSNLDVSTFKVLSSSHMVATNPVAFEGSKIIRFDFNDIKLADKDHPETNKGFVIYQVKAKSDLSPLTSITNTAHIFFDVNPAIVTNTVESIIPDPSSIKGATPESAIKVYPNPVSSILNIDNQNGYTSVIITNALGQQVISQDLGKGTNKIDVAHLSAGIYYLLANHNSGLKDAVKFVIK